MEYVVALLKNKNKLILLPIDAIKDGKVSEKDIIELRCIGCGEKAHVYHSKLGDLSFRCEKHNNDCSELQKEDNDDNKYILKKKKIYSDTYTCIDLLLYGSDRAPKENKVIEMPPIEFPGDEGQDDNPQKQDKNEDDFGNDGIEKKELTPEELEKINKLIKKIDPNTPEGAEQLEELFRYEFKIKNIKTMSPLFKAIKEIGYGFDMGDGRTARDVVLDEYSLRKIRRTGFEGSKIALLVRLKPEEIAYLKKTKVIRESKYEPIEYVYLKDAFSSDIENAIIFKVKCQNPKQNIYFKNKVMGSKKDNIKKDSKPYIVIFSFWEKVQNSFMAVYSANITFRQYAFFSDVNIGAVDE